MFAGSGDGGVESLINFFTAVSSQHRWSPLVDFNRTMLGSNLIS